MMRHPVLRAHKEKLEAQSPLSSYFGEEGRAFRIFWCLVLLLCTYGHLEVPCQPASYLILQQTHTPHALTQTSMHRNLICTHTHHTHTHIPPTLTQIHTDTFTPYTLHTYTSIHSIHITLTPTPVLGMCAPPHAFPMPRTQT